MSKLKKDDLFYLEYNQDKGRFYFNDIVTGHPKSEPDTYGWETIAFTTDKKAGIFCHIIDCKNEEYKTETKQFLSVETVKKEWRYFCLMFNYIIEDIYIYAGEKFAVYQDYIKKFDFTKELIKMNHPCFKEWKEDEDAEYIENILDYDEKSFLDSNF